MRRLRVRDVSLLASAGILVVVIACALISLVWTPFDPGVIDPLQRLAGPGWPHLLGTDTFGRDTASRLMAGSQICLVVGFVSVAIAAVIGIPLGMFAGMSRGVLASVVLRLTDLLYAFPGILLAMLLAAAFGGSTLTGMVAIGIATVPVFTRITRAGTLAVVSQDYITAARASGLSWLSVAWRHVWPNVMPLVGVQTSASFGMAILSEAALSFLGLATQPTTPTWGRMLYDAQQQLFNAPSQIVWPALAIVITVLACNILGDALRDRLDPRLREVS